MSSVHLITDPADPRVSDYFSLTDVALRRKLETPRGLFMAESVEVIGRAIDAGYVPRSFLIKESWMPAVEEWSARFDAPIYVGSEEVLTSLVGFRMHRGALAAMNRHQLPQLDEVLSGAKTTVIVENVVDHTNVGAIFRSVAALGADAVLVTPQCADPLYRRSVRVSMGTVFQVPWTRTESWTQAREALHAHGVRLVGMGFGDTAIDIRQVPRDRPLALAVGTEGTGLSPAALRSVDVLATIPMRGGVDSLNVAAAAAVGIWELVRG